MEKDDTECIGPLLKNQFIFLENSKISQAPINYSPFAKFEITVSFYLSKNSIQV